MTPPKFSCVKETKSKEVPTVLFHLYENLDQLKLPEVISIRAGAGLVGVGDFLGRDMGVHSGVMEMFIA